MIINNINNKIEDLKNRAILENRIYKKIINKNRRLLKTKKETDNERQTQKKNYFLERKKYNSAKSTQLSLKQAMSF